MRPKKELPKPSIVTLFEHYGSSIRPGYGWQKATCVLHEDNHPSASINDDICRWRCYSCGESGDAIDLIMKVDNVGFASARATAETFLDGSSDGVQQSDHTAGGLLPHRTGARPGGRKFVPSWRSM